MTFYSITPDGDVSKIEATDFDGIRDIVGGYVQVINTPRTRANLIPSANRNDRLSGTIVVTGEWKDDETIAGAPHERERLFIAAIAVTPDATIAGLQRRSAPKEWPTVAGGSGDSAETLWQLPSAAYRSADTFDFAEFQPVIDRWAGVVGRRPTYPVLTGAHGAPVNSPRFVEWMMGLPEGWVTDIPALSVADMLQLLGNGVVPQQAALAITKLFGGDVDGAVPDQ